MAKPCHGRQPENASRRNIATVSHSRMHYSYILPIKSLHSCAKVQHARFSPCRIRAAVGYGERCRRCSVGHRERFRKHAQSWCWGISCRRGLPAAGERPATGGAVGCGLGTRPRGGHRLHGRTAAGGHPATGRDCRLRAGPPTAARSAANRLSTARTSTMPKTRMNPFTPTFPRYCTVIGFICYVTNI